MFELKQLSKEGIPGALAKAERYRLLNEAWEAESIYRDVVEIDPDNQEALAGLLLAITDQFDELGSGSVQRAHDVLPRLSDGYARAYYGGLVCERRAKAVLRQARPGFAGMVYDLLTRARQHYEQAEALRPPGNDDVLLRWNACARLLRSHPELVAAPEERFVPYGDS